MSATEVLLGPSAPSCLSLISLGRLTAVVGRYQGLWLVIPHICSIMAALPDSCVTVAVSKLGVAC